MFIKTLADSELHMKELQMRKGLTAECAAIVKKQIRRLNMY